MPSITTYSGRRFTLDPIDSDQIRLCDIAHQLAGVNRFSGACRKQITVAQHSIMVMEVACKLAKAEYNPSAISSRERSLELAAIAIMHDAAEAYPPNDVATPAKTLGGGHLLQTQYEIQRMIFRRYNCAVTDLDLPEVVTTADRIVLRAEARDLMHENCPIPDYWDEPIVVSKINPWGAEEAELRWLVLAADALAAIGTDIEDEIAEAINLLLPEVPAPMGKGYAAPTAIKLRLVMSHLQRSRSNA